MDELNKGYEFTKAQIAELESLRAENAMLKSSSIDKVVKIIAETEVWKECKTLRARLAEIEKQEPIYQLQSADGIWIDQYKHSYDYNVANGHGESCRIVFAAPVVSHDVEKLLATKTARISQLEQIVETMRDSQIDKLLAMTDEQVTALCRLEGSNPDDSARIAKQSIQLAECNVKAKELEVEIEKLKRYDDEVKAELEAENQSLKTELEAARKDAERYRVLRDSEYQLHEDDPCVSDSFFNSYYGTDLDAAADELKARFDAAIEQKGGACKTCNGEGGWESAASYTSYFWTECPACVNTKGGVK